MTTTSVFVLDEDFDTRLGLFAAGFATTARQLSFGADGRQLAGGIFQLSITTRRSARKLSWRSYTDLVAGQASASLSAGPATAYLLRKTLATQLCFLVILS